MRYFGYLMPYHNYWPDVLYLPSALLSFLRSSSTFMDLALTDKAQGGILPKKIQHDDSFYFEDDPMAVFLVEDRLFKVHRHFLVKGSEFFRDMFSAPGKKNNGSEGTCDEQPIPLPDVTLKEFQTLLRFFYSMPLPDSKNGGSPGSVTLAGIIGLGLDEKLALLSISHRFLFDNLFNYVLREVTPGDIPVLERIRLGDKYGLSDWLSSAYETLLDQIPESLSTEEANSLGYTRIAALFGAKHFMLRECLQIAEAKANKHPNCYSCGYQFQCSCYCRSCGTYQSNQVCSNVTTQALTSTRLVVQKYFHI